jgi:hypothetical protein
LDHVVFRATPGFGYAWELSSTACPLQGRIFAGGIDIGYRFTPSLAVGLGIVLAGNILPIRAGCESGPGLGGVETVVFGAIGPFVNWFPLEDQGWHVLLVTGWGGVNQGGGSNELKSNGIGAVLAFGYEWPMGESGLRLGMMAETMAFVGGTGRLYHANVAPALLITFALR